MVCVSRMSSLCFGNQHGTEADVQAYIINGNVLVMETWGVFS